MMAKIDLLAATDSVLITKDDGRTVLVYSGGDAFPYDPRRDVMKEIRAGLRRHLEKAGRETIDAVCISRRGHCKLVSEFFWFEHALAYQTRNRIRIGELRVSASLLTDDDTGDGVELVRNEALFRLRQGKGVIVFLDGVSPRSWLERHGVDFESCRHLLVDIQNKAGRSEAA